MSELRAVVITKKKAIRLWCRNTVKRQKFFNRQYLDLTENNPNALKVITRCIRYGDRIPRKYRIRYGDVIVRMKMFHLGKPKLIGKKC